MKKSSSKSVSQLKDERKVLLNNMKNEKKLINNNQSYTNSKGQTFTPKHYKQALKADKKELKQYNNKINEEIIKSKSKKKK